MKSKNWKVAGMLDLKGMEGIWRLPRKPCKVSQNITKPWFKVTRKTTYKKLQIYTEWLRFGYGIEIFFEKEAMILLLWK